MTRRPIASAARDLIVADRAAITNDPTGWYELLIRLEDGQVLAETQAKKSSETTLTNPNFVKFCLRLLRAQRCEVISWL